MDSSHTSLTQEMAIYRKRKAELVAQHEGQWVAIVGGDVLGVFQGVADAYHRARERKPVGPVLVKQLLREERPLVVNWLA